MSCFAPKSSTELRWLMGSTVDTENVIDAPVKTNLRASLAHPRAGSERREKQDCGWKAWGRCFMNAMVSFRLDASYDGHFFPRSRRQTISPLLDRVNSPPEKLAQYVNSISVSDVAPQWGGSSSRNE